jgi:adenine-specific DNA-methyltransferase
MTAVINQLVSDIEKIGYHAGVLLEKKVKEILITNGIRFEYQPNGSQRFPDFFIKEHNLNLECKSSSGSKPMWNCSYPKQDTLYVISCKPLDKCMVLKGSELISEDIVKIYDEYATKHKQLEKEINEKLEKIGGNVYGMRVFARNMFVQTVGFNKKQKPVNGQYFTTSKAIQDKLLDDYEPKDKGNLSILEPSSGLGHLIELVKDFGTVVAYDIDEHILSESKCSYPEVEHIHADFLTAGISNKFDLIIGNPPYFEMKKGDVPAEFSGIVSGRINIYYLFIYKCINLLKDGGELRFVIPKSFLSNKYALNIRKYMVKHCQIIGIEFFNGNNHFKDAVQDVIVIKCRKTSNPDNSSYVFNNGRDLLFVKDAHKLPVSGDNIISIGCYVKTGSIVWNTHKELLTDTHDETTARIWYASDISEKPNTNEQKKPFLVINGRTKHRLISGPCILVQRIVSGKIICKFIQDTGIPFFVENHINVVLGDVQKLSLVYRSLLDDRTGQFISSVLHSTQVSKNELEGIIPIYLDLD